jgi:putative flippase GtrA
VIRLHKLIAFIKKQKSLILYAVFGVLTTLVNFLVFFPLYNYFGLTVALSNAIAWLLAVLFSFFTNKPFVFGSNNWTAKNTLRELANFIGCRLITGVLETLLLYVLVDVLYFNGSLWKIIISVLVVILNYIFSRLIVFKK